jgi:putative transcriptional regulator
MRRRDLVSVACGILLTAAALLAQSKNADDLAAGKLLVVPRAAPDPAFAETVILLVRYEPNGALGLILNRPTEVPIARALRDLKGSAKNPDSLYLGGPVDVASVMALLRATAPPPNGLRIFGDVFMLNTKKDLEGALNSPKTAGNLRVYVGYCGWTAGQLRNEVKLGGWYIFDRSEEEVFDAKPETLWSRLIARTELRMARDVGRPILAAAALSGGRIR